MATLGEDLLNTVNRLQDLVFNTIGTDSLDLPQIVRAIQRAKAPTKREQSRIRHRKLTLCSGLGRCWIAIIWKIICT